MISVLSHFLNHAQNKVRVSVDGLTRFVNMTDWMKKVISVLNHFLNHAQNKVRVSVDGLTRFVNMTD